MATEFEKKFELTESADLFGGTEAEVSFGRIPLVEVAFPVDENGVVFPTLDIDTQSLGQLKITAEVQGDGFDIVDVSGNVYELNITNKLITEEVYIAQPTPCLLDLDGNGIVTAGDIQAVFAQNIGKTYDEIAEEFGQEFADTLDLNEDGVVSDEDFTLALGFEGEVGCVPEPQLTYPYYLEDAQRVAFAYSLRKLRPDYTGPCMSVSLDVDKRALAPQSAGIKFWQEFGSMLAISGEDIRTESLIGDPEVDMYQQWLNFVGQFPWLLNTIDVPFDDSGYVDYSIIQDMMVDPPKAFGVKSSMTAEEYQDFTTRWNQVPDDYERTSWYLASVVLVERWYDQRADEQRDFVPRNNIQPEALANKNEGNGGRTHPFSKSTLIVGRTTKDKQKKGVVNHDGRFCLGSGCTYGLGQAPWLQTSDFSYPVFDGFNTPSNDGILYPGTPQQVGSGAPGLTDQDLQPGWWNWWQYDPEDNGTRVRLGDMSMIQETTNAQYNNPFYNGSQSIFDEGMFAYDGSFHPANSSGRRSILSVTNQSSTSGGSMAGLSFSAAVPGNARPPFRGYTDRKNYFFDNNRPLSTNQQSSTINNRRPLNSESGDFTDNVNCFAFVSEHEVTTKDFIFNRDHYFEEIPTWPAGTAHAGEPCYNTFAAQSGARMFLGKQQDFITTGPPSMLGNWFEFIGWNSRLTEDYVKEYLYESKSYFTNKKISQ